MIRQWHDLIALSNRRKDHNLTNEVMCDRLYDPRGAHVDKLSNAHKNMRTEGNKSFDFINRGNITLKDSPTYVFCRK